MTTCKSATGWVKLLAPGEYQGAFALQLLISLQLRLASALFAAKTCRPSLTLRRGNGVSIAMPW